MDPTQFDRLTQTLAVRFSRRGALGALTGSALGAALGLGALREAEAVLKPADAKCSSDTQCASGTCINYGRCNKSGRLTGKCRCSCSETALCPTGKSCQNEACFGGCADPITCSGGTGDGCGRCPCGHTDLGDFCMGRSILCSGNTCETSADCPTGSACLDLGGTCLDPCPAKLCANPCGQGYRLPTTSSSATAASQSSTRSADRKDVGDILEIPRH
jgi:hypothetical protein